MPVSSRESVAEGRILYWTCWGAILLLAVLFRVLPIPSGLPYSDYVDEGYALHQTTDAFNNNNLDVHWYGYPALPAYSVGAALFLYGPLYQHFHGNRFQDDLPHDPTRPSSRVNYDLIAPVELIVAGRIVTACLGIASVILAGIVAKRLMNRQAGILAMLFVAICPALVTRSSIVIVDTFATFFVLVTIYFCERLQSANNPTSRHAAFAGIAAGLAFASKYPAIAVSLAVVASIVLVQVGWRRRFQLLLVAGVGLIAGMLLGAPMMFLKPATVWRDFAENVRNYGVVHSPQGYFAQAVSTVELGVPLLLVGFGGLLLMLRNRKTRTGAVVWILFAAALIAPFLNSPFRPFRSFLPLVPLLGIAAAITVSNLIDWSRRGVRPWLRFGVTVAVLSVCVVSLGFSSFQQVRQRMLHRDSRIQAVDWLREHAGKDETVLGIQELAILPAEWKRIAARSTVVPWFEAMDLLQRQQFDYIVTGEFELRFADDPKAWSVFRDSWNATVSSLPRQADFGYVGTPTVPYIWRTSDERILILKGSAQ